MGAVTFSLLESVTQAIQRIGLECVVIGNSASALQGAPVTTLDVDFLFRNIPQNIQKLKRLAKSLKGHLTQPFEPVSDLWRLVTDEVSLDFMSRMDGIRSFESLRSRAQSMKVGTAHIWVASLEDVIKSKKIANRDKDKATLPILEKSLAVKKALKKA